MEQYAGNGHAAAVQPPARPQQIGQPRYRPSEYESGRPRCASPLAPLCQPACQVPHFLQVTQTTVFHSKHVTKIQAFWGVMPCRLVNSYWRLEESQCFHFQSQLVGQAGQDRVSLDCLTLRRRHYAPSKRQ